ncbi:uncharacterized protein LOC119074551 isoform X2 [Bradysia coprophila]|uniref:uncharacterized protein LOC119074551 isoform X2 n=1 Tax=Bradysia coprophila TaxID=38358 RepID=UPI00187DAA3F|nr:uncharacterized protein LOC119074551 isoform X2 [Bradysia coprophila]
MSTRKTKMNADSPTPNSGNESAPATPKGRKRLIRNKVERPDDKDEAVKKTDKVENNKTDTKKDDKAAKVEKETPTKKRGPAKNISKDDLILLSKTADTDADKTTKSILARDTRPKRKSASAIILAKAVQKKKALSPKTDPVKRGRKRRNSTGRLDVLRKQPERLRKDDPIRKGRSSTLLKSPDKLIKAGRKRLGLTDKTDEKLPKRIKKEKLEPSSDSELLAASRRRSDSISKCSDMTDISSLMDVPLNMLRDTEESLNSNESPDCIEDKVIDSGGVIDSQIDVKNKDLDQLVAPVLNDSGIGNDSSQATKVEFISPRAVTPVLKDDAKDSHIDVFNCDLVSAKVLTVTTPEVIASEEKDNSEKSSSLSPVLESEGISEISVKQFYGQPDFLENNLGIEEDPKLGEIVQVHEKTKLDTEIVQENKENAPVEVNEPPKEATPDLDTTVEENENAAEDLKNETETEMEVEEDDAVKLKVTTNGVHDIVPKEDNVVVSETEEADKAVTPEVVEKVGKSEVSDKMEESVEIVEEKLKTDDEIVPVTNSPKQTITRDEPMIEPENKENILNNFKDSADDKKNAIPMNDDKSDVPTAPESPERLKQKESHFLTLGLLTHKAAVAAKIEKQKQREQLHSNSKSSKSQRGSDYTGTLKTVIKLHRPTGGGDKNDKKKSRLPLKMTLHKGRGKSVNDKETTSAHNSEDDTYYTIQNEQVDNSLDKTHEATVASEPADGTKEIEKALVIPEKASSFRIHPDKICQDQCFYCGGRFGLFDTPCHVAQIKSLERQKKILDNEEKLTVDNCLCDACFRHVDRRANCPSYKKRLSANSSADYNNFNDSTEESPRTSETHGSHKSQMCNVADCEEIGSHTVRRKWFMKMKRSISKLLNLNLEGLAVGTLSICDNHYDTISHLMVCALCKRKLMRNHIYYVSQEAARLEELLKQQGIPVMIGTSPVVCKLCRYYSNLLLKPPEGKSQKAMFAKNYRKRLLQFNNVEASDDEAEAENKTQCNDEMTPQQQQQQKQNQSTGKRGRPPKRPRPSQESVSSPPSNISESGDKPSNQSTGQIMMDTDVMVDYDPPAMYTMAAMMQNKIKSKGLSMTIEPKQPSKEDISLLRGNPNISMRELFPGEEEMGLQVNIPFNTGGQRTPEGWTKIMTTIQYDEPTKHLWEELQKPYGNQSSFLRHLILLEKYFRNGDLVLTPGATYSAVNYSESVQQRLQSFDSRCTSNYSLNNLYKMSNSPISIFSTTKAKPKPTATETTSLLKYSSEQQRQEAQLAKQRKVQQQQQIQQQQLAKAQAAKREQLLASSLRTTKPEDQTKTLKQGGVPPELISINSTKQATAATVAPNLQAQTQQQQQQQTPNHSKSTKQSESNSLLIPSTSSSGQKKSSNTSKTSSQANIIRLPDILSPAERLESNKWRPTLMPVSAGPPALDGQLYQSADGRKLPNLVQVQSGGKPYLISIHDYNRMCIMRRERLLREQMIERQQQAQQNMANQQQQAMANQSLLQKMQQHSTAQLNASQQPSISIHSTPKTMTMTSNAEENTNKISMSITQIPNKILEQNSVIPLNSKSSTLDSLLKVRKTNSASLLKPNLQTSTATKPSHTITTMNQQNVISITSTPSISAILGAQPISLGNAASIPSTSKSPTTSSSSALDALMKTTQQATQSNMWSWAETLNSNGSVVIDNSAATLLSKIPKSLTVIPQQKSRSSKSSSED